MKKVWSVIIIVVFYSLFINNIIANSNTPKQIIINQNITVVGLRATTNAIDFELDREKLWKNITTMNIEKRIPNRSNKNKYVVFTNFNGDSFDIIIGVAVNFVDKEKLNPGFAVVEIQKGNYKKYTVKAGNFPKNVNTQWDQIKADSDLNMLRNFTTDYEVYTAKALLDLNKANVDIYISVIN